MTEREWKDRFIAQFTERLTKGGYRGTDIQEIAREHANCSLDCRHEPGMTEEPKEAADGEYDALCDSV